MEQILTASLRDKLKKIVSAELEGLEDQLKDMEPEKRLNVVFKLLPFVCPKVDSVNHTNGEPFQRWS